MGSCDPCTPKLGPWVSKTDPLGPLSCDDGTKPDNGDGTKPDTCGLEGPFGPGCINWNVGPNECPTPPQNVEVVSPYTQGTLDIRWDDPAVLDKNGKFAVVGVNIYRSDTSERGPYQRLNALPVGGLFYRDYTQNIFVQNEVIPWESGWIDKGNAANNARWKFRPRHFPIVKKGGVSVPANSPLDIQVMVDGKEVEVQEVFGPTGEITLVNTIGYDPAQESWVYAPVITSTTSVWVTYYYQGPAVRTDLDKKIWYRVTTVAQDPASPTGFRETPLIYTEPKTFRAVEAMDWIWREAIRRNNWILEQGGERVYAFVRKTSGKQCFCNRDPRSMEYSQQPDSRCLECFGTGFLGGYEGPYPLIISPDDSPRTVRQNPTGRNLDHQRDTWTGPSPLLTQRDFLVMQTNERYSVGPTHKPSNRGNIMQQHFQIRYLDEQDIRYKVPMFSTTEICWPETRYRPAVMQGGAWMVEYPPTGPYPVGGAYHDMPMQTEKENIPNEREQRGRTPTWANNTY